MDNTFLTPVLSRPLDLGADIVIHSGTKYIAGHNDSLVGLIIAKGQELCDRIAYIQNGAGAVLSPFDSWLTVRGMKTLSLRMKRHQDNAKAIAEFLREQPQIDSVLYPNKGGMLSFRLKDEKLGKYVLKINKIDYLCGKLRRYRKFYYLSCNSNPHGYSRSGTCCSWYLQTHYCVFLLA